MAETSGGEVIQRKIRAADGRKPDPAVMEFAESLTAQIAEALLLEPKFNLQPQFENAEITSYRSLLSALSPKSLYAYTIDILFHIENELAFRWIEKSLSGESIDAESIGDYEPTAIDAHLSRPLFECLLTSLQRDLPKKYRLPETAYEDEMMIERSVDNVHFVDESTKVVVLNYAFAASTGEAGGNARIVLPLSIIEEIALTAKPRTLEDAPTSGLWTQHMTEETLNLPLEVTAVVEKTKMTVDDIARLSPGALILLPKKNLEQVVVAVETPKGVTPLTHGKLGLKNQSKAVKLSAAPRSQLQALARATGSTSGI
ncbi:MAG: FliM/FliN family flagellar motor switch protein [Pseudomonadota bacterium]